MQGTPPVSEISGDPRHFDHAVPVDLNVHLFVDNYATHKHPRGAAGLARHMRYHAHRTPS